MVPGTTGGGGRLPASAQLLGNNVGAPTVRTQGAGSGTNIDFTFSPAATTILGTTAPGFDFVIQSPEAVNIPARVHVYQNNRNAEATGTIIPITKGISPLEGLQDIVYDSTRQPLYISNSGMNRVEVFDIRQNRLLSPIKVGQLPHSMPIPTHSTLLYVSNSGADTLRILNLHNHPAVHQVRFPP